MKSDKTTTTKNIKVPEGTVDRVLGQDEAVKIIKKAAQQRRHVLLIGEPGTGKSMLGMALAELLPKSDLKDILAYPNLNDENNPFIKTLAAGKGREEAQKYLLDANQSLKNNSFILFIIAIITFILPWWVRYHYHSDLMFTAFFLGGMLFLAGFAVTMNMGPRMFQSPKNIAPKVIVDNHSKKIAPFFDATGAHAGALLGDVLHDPFQSLNSDNKIKFIDDKNKIKVEEIKSILNQKFKKHASAIEKRKEKNYEAIFLPKKDLVTFGETNNSITPVEVLSCNRYDYVGEMIKLTTSENKELIVTPEHKIAVWRNGKTEYIEAKDIKEGDEVVAQVEEVIIDEQDIINIYDARQQEQCKLYHKYLELKAQNPTWGYKRIAKAMNQPIGKTRWWHAQKHLPYPIQTINWLKERGLLPLKIDNPKLPVITKVLGATFGDGGIFENLNGIFLSSSEKEAVEEFGKDLEETFGLHKDQNSRIIEGGVYGHSWCYQNTNRNIIYFFLALGAPRGNKTYINLIIPPWIRNNSVFEEEFFGSLFGSEIGIPKIHVSGKHLNTFDFAITGKPGLEDNRIDFLNMIKIYLANHSIKTGETSKRLIKKSDREIILYRFLFSTKFENLINFSKYCKLNYCQYKKEKLTNTINQFKKEKNKKYQDLLARGYGAESAMNLLNLTPSALYEILNDTKFIVRERGAEYS